MPLDDPSLVAAVLDGEARAFESLVDRYKNRVFAFVLRMLKNRQDAEDAAQETFIKAFRKLSSYDPSYSFISWLFRIAHNTVIDHKRKDRRAEVPLEEEDSVRELAAVEIPVERLASSRLEGELVERLLAALPPLYRESLLLKHKEGMEYREISGILKVPEGTAKARVSRGTAMLKERLRAAGLGGDEK